MSSHYFVGADLFISMPVNWPTRNQGNQKETWGPSLSHYLGHKAVAVVSAAHRWLLFVKAGKTMLISLNGLYQVNPRHLCYIVESDL